MKALIIGVSGQVGSNLERACAAKGIKVYGADINVAGPAAMSGGNSGLSVSQVPERLHIDITKPDSALAVFEAAAPETVFLCAAMTYVDGCEKNPALAEKVNAGGAEIAADCCRRFGSKLVYLSTEYVFDGKSGPYSEADTPNPLSVYGRTKLQGEQAVLRLSGALSIRTTVVYSYAPGEKNFLMQLLAAAGAKTGKMRVPNDQYSNPTYAPELAEFILELVLKNKSGVYNVVGPERLDRYSFALKACEILGLNSSFLVPVSTSDLAQAAARPLYAGLKTDKIMAELGRVPSGATDALKIIKGLLSNACSA